MSLNCPVVWLIGLSGSGKTTLSQMLWRKLLSEEQRVSFIDGDDARNFFRHDLGYSRGDRIENIKRIIFAAHLLSENKIITIISNISPFEELRRLARSKIPEYNEIYLHKSLTAVQRDDPRKIYATHSGRSELVGIEIPFDEPRQCDLVLDTESGTPAESFKALRDFLAAKYPGLFSTHK